MTPGPGWLRKISNPPYAAEKTSVMRIVLCKAEEEEIPVNPAKEGE